MAWSRWILPACLLLLAEASTALAASHDPLDGDALLADLAAIHASGPTGSLAPYIVEAAVANGIDPSTWPDPADPALGRVEVPDGDILHALRPAHAMAKAGALPWGLEERLRASRDGDVFSTRDVYNDDLWTLRTLELAGGLEDGEVAVAQRVADLQHADGGWGWRVGGASEADMTGAVAEWLASAGFLDAAAREAATAYLETVWNADGGAAQRPGGPSNCNSTVWTIRGLHALGADVPDAAWDYLRGLRVAGGLAYQTGQPHLPLCTAEVATLVGDVAPPEPSGHDAPALWPAAPLILVSVLVRYRSLDPKPLMMRQRSNGVGRCPTA